MRAIKNIQNLSLTELLATFQTNEDFHIFNIDIYNHIYRLTNGLNKKLMDTLILDLVMYCLENIPLRILGELINYEELMESDVMDKYLEFSRVKKLGMTEEIIKSYHNYPNNFVINSILFSVDVSDNELKIENEKTFEYIRLYDESVAQSYIDKFGEEEYFKRGKEIGGFKSVEITKFDDLFKKEYQSKIDEFRKWLKREEYINDANEITASNYTNFARLFYLLRDNSIIKPNINNTKGITAYFKEFGVNVVETLNSLSETPEIARKTVTNENAKDFTQLGMTEKETTNLLNLFKNN
jgi:hypothetical protein